MSPKIVNGSFAAIFDNSEVLHEFAKKLQLFKLDVKDSPGKGKHKVMITHKLIKRLVLLC